MSPKRQLFKTKKQLFKSLERLIKQYLSAIKKPIIWLLRNLFLTKRRRSSANAGFVLPTVALVALVVVLLTTAILFRSFERAKNASNVRVNEMALNAATPALDRARAKINKLFQDPKLPRATPTDDALYGTVTSSPDSLKQYTFGDETPLKLVEGANELETGWMYPVDTDNNGKFDSYTLYGIYFKNPPVTGGAYTRKRNALEARTPPMTVGSVSSSCGDGQDTSAALVGNTGWFRNGTKLKKAFFVYTATVPITSEPTDPTNYETKKGNKGFSALEYQQDRVQLPLVNNAVVYEDDLGIAPGPAFRLNGRIFTNSNLLTGLPAGGVGIRLYQVSGNSSCFYDPDNAKIVIGGNLSSGVIIRNVDSNGTTIDLYKGKTTAVTNVAVRNATTNNKSVNHFPRDVAYNSLAYVQRINRLVEAQVANAESSDPSEVSEGMEAIVTKQGRTLADLTTIEKDKLRRNQIELYFKRRTRRVPYQEVGFGNGALGDYAVGGSKQDEVLQGSGDTLRPPDAWIYPVDSADGVTATDYAQLALSTNGTDKLNPPATEPIKLAKELQGVEQSFGDRVLIGNNLPQLWWDKTKEAFVGPNAEDTQTIKDYKWDNGEGDRTRRSRVETLKDLGTTDRDGDWELAAAQIPISPQEPVGGLRVITGAGIYLPETVTAANLASTTYSTLNKDIWPDLLPVKTSSVPSPIKPYYNDYGLELEYKVPQPTDQPYLRMRATAVYHYKSSGYSQTSPTPIACVSSYYDPTDKDTARNISTLWNPPADTGATFDDTKAQSNNGIVYDFPTTKTESNYSDVLSYLADLTYPTSGRLIDDGLLRRALDKTDATKRTLSEKSAIDAAICGLAIFDGTLNTPSDTVIPHGAIYETAFLDARQIKDIHANPDSTNYDKPKKDRQPLEIRATVLDIDKLRQKTIGNSTPAQEYLLPNSGIVYASRDDALLDLSGGDTEAGKLESPVDYKLDPNRRPNAIMLVNGKEIGRATTNTYRDAEKGLILATNVPAYIKGDFNLHTQEEFVTALNSTWGNFYSRTDLNSNFACRPGDPRLPKCTTGDKWRSATVLADSMTVLSNNFRFGFRNEAGYDWQLDTDDPTTIEVESNINLLPTKYGLPNAYTNFFSTVNSFVPNANWHDESTSSAFPRDLVADVAGDATTTDFQGSSYLNNFVTPIVRKVRAKKLVLEVCYTTPCSEPRNWTIKKDCPLEGEVTHANWRDIIVAQPDLLSTGFIGTPPTSTCPFLDGKPYRIAFARNTTNGNITTPLKVYGVNTTNTIEEVPWPVTSATSIADAFDTSTPPEPYFIPWFAGSTTSGNNVVFQPIFQFDRPFGTLATTDNGILEAGKHGKWLQTATETTFNVISAVGDTPAASSRTTSPSRGAEDNGGLPNFVRFIENWNSDPTATAVRMSGAFYQVKRSAYATAPFIAAFSSDFYKINSFNGTTRGVIPYYLAPLRQWGYDVALLSQSPDLFAQKLITIPDDLPDEFFREVGRDDPWVKTLLCAKKAADDTNATDACS
ncbi:hormogonium polysaccharide biosynthesis protein HpsA [Anabaena sp. CCY 9402-a]|uniref:hormogonium polysaccharide biosynthesis protein HpsA n=1 Tax=Anabaena sp. CCY 9402-a TaxID=3103867 RepID=UPI0039C6A05E